MISILYLAVLFFSHTPRLPTSSELTYITNDETDQHYDIKTAPNINNLELSVVIPCFNETKRLGKMLDEATEFLELNYPHKYEILIIDDGSSDNTDSYSIRKANQLKLLPHTLKVIKLSKNRGKGGAVTHGLINSNGKLSLFADADGATKFSDVSRLIEFFQSKELSSDEPGVAIGSRAHMVTSDAVVKRSFIRNFLMYGLHTLVFIFGIRQIKDTQCGFKMFNQSAIQKIFPNMHNEKWIFDVEILLLANLQKIKIKEIPVNWKEIDGSKIDLAKDSIGMAIDLVVTRLAYILGVYKLNECGRLDNNKKYQ